MSTARGEIDAELLAWMRSGDWSFDEVRFNETARELFAFQFAHCEPYARFCKSRGITPADNRSYRDIPAVPTGAFKELPLRCFDAADTCKTFRTSGTSTERRGELHLDTLELYEASLLPTIRRHLLPDLEEEGRMAIRVLAPSPVEAPDSSLSHMFGLLLDACGGPGSGYDLGDGQLQLEALCDELDVLCADGEAVALCGTAFAFVHLIDALGPRRLQLPPGSRIMETGGFKGRSRSVSREALHAELSELVGVPVDRILNQYGMTELGSQFYDCSLSQPSAPRRKLGPPWARVRITDAESGNEVKEGEAGVIVIHDLANTGSIAAIQTADVGVQIGDGFEVLGRDANAEARGCSIAADVMLSS